MTLMQFVSSRPVVYRFVMMRYLAAACSLGGCVPSTAYEEANSAAEVEREGHRRAAQQLGQLEAELEALKRERDQLSAEKHELLARLENDELALAQATLDIEHEKKGAEQNEELLTQLRGELARVGEHVKVYSGQKSDLETELALTKSLLDEKEARVAALEAEVLGLKGRAESASAEQEQLNGALDELTQLQEQVKSQSPVQEGPESDAPESKSPDPVETAAEVVPEAAADFEPAPGEVEEVLPAEEEASAPSE